MPTINLPGLPPLTMSDAQVQQFMAQNPALAPQVRAQLGIPAPTTATSSANAGNTLGRRKAADPNHQVADPCTVAKNYTGSVQAVKDRLNALCKDYQDAQAFAMQGPPLTAEQIATMAPGDEAAPDGMSTGMKIGLIAGGVVLLGAIAYFATR